MSKATKRPSVPTLQMWGRTETASSPTDFKSSVGGWQKGSALTRLVLDKQKPQSGNSRIIAGFRAPTSFRAYVCSVSKGGSWEYQGLNTSGLPVSHRGEFGLPPISNNIYVGTTGTGRFPFDDGSSDRAITECLNNVAAQKTNASESLATSTQTLDMLVASIEGLVGLLLAAARFLRGKPSDLRRRFRSFAGTKSARAKLRKYAGKAATNEWLKYQYGWKPLMNDIWRLHGELKGKLDAVANKSIFARAKVTNAATVPVPTPMATGALMRAQGRITNGAICRIDMDVITPTLRTLNQWGFINPLALGWELIPFSFVIDWLLPIGQTLSALSADVGLRFKAGSVTRFTRATVNYQWTQYRFVSGSAISATVKSLSTWRWVLSQTPLPRLFMKSPFSLTRSVTALALLSKLA